MVIKFQKEILLLNLMDLLYQKNSQISMELLMKTLNEGVNLQSVLNHFHSLVNNSETLVAHNMSFDEKIIGSEFLRFVMNNSIPAKRKICTLQCTTNFCKI